jgi:hypothetical protein
MSSSSARLVTRFGLILVALSSLHSQTLSGATRPDNAGRATQLLRDLYPALEKEHALVEYHFPLWAGGTPATSFRENLRFILYKSYQSVGPDGRPQSHDVPLFAAQIGFLSGPDDPHLKRGQLMSVISYGPFISGRVDELAKELNKHGEWSDAQLISQLKAAGAKFGPNDREAFIRALPLKVLEPLTGRLEIVDATFWARYDTPSRDVSLTWTVITKWLSDDGRYQAEYFLYFEPFEGALFSLDYRGERPVR